MATRRAAWGHRPTRGVPDLDANRPLSRRTRRHPSSPHGAPGDIPRRPSRACAAAGPRNGTRGALPIRGRPPRLPAAACTATVGARRIIRIVWTRRSSGGRREFWGRPSRAPARISVLVRYRARRRRLARNCVRVIFLGPRPRGAGGPPAFRTEGNPWKSSYRKTRPWSARFAGSSERSSVRGSIRSFGSAASTRSPAPGASGGARPRFGVNAAGNAGAAARRRPDGRHLGGARFSLGSVGGPPARQVSPGAGCSSTAPAPDSTLARYSSSATGPSCVHS